MGSSAKKKKEKSQDFKKTKLKVGKARPKNTNATDTSFTAKSIVLKQQSLTEGSRSPAALFNHNLSLLSSKTDTQRRDALAYLTATILANPTSNPLPQPPSAILAKAQPLILDGSASVRAQLLKLLQTLPPTRLGPLDQTLLYTRAGMSHLSTDIRLSALAVLAWLLQSNSEAVVSCAGGWIKMLKTFQNLLSWTAAQAGSVQAAAAGQWSSAKPNATGSLGSSKLLVQQLNTLAAFLSAGLARRAHDSGALAVKAAEVFPLWQVEGHVMSAKSNCFGYLNLFGAARDLESEMYDDPEERCEAFVESGLFYAFSVGVQEAKKEGGEVGRASSGVAKALRLAGQG